MLWKDIHPASEADFTALKPVERPAIRPVGSDI